MVIDVPNELRAAKKVGIIEEIESIFSWKQTKNQEGALRGAGGRDRFLCLNYLGQGRN